MTRSVWLIESDSGIRDVGPCLTKQWAEERIESLKLRDYRAAEYVRLDRHPGAEPHADATYARVEFCPFCGVKLEKGSK